MAKTILDAQNFINELVSNIGAKIETIETIYDEESGLNTISIKSGDGRILIGKDGETLHSLVTLLHRFMETGLKETDTPTPVGLDVNDFQKKHIEDLKIKANMMAERAKFFKSSIELDPMNGYERRIIHTFLEKDKNITTESTGLGKERRIVVTYKEE